MQDHTKFTDHEFEESFTHEAHLRLAWIHLGLYGLHRALSNVTTQLRNFTAHLGATDKYNETMTVAAIHAVHHFMIRSTTSNFSDFITENPRLVWNFKELMASHYSTDIFQSAEAKSRYLEPDLLPFD